MLMLLPRKEVVDLTSLADDVLEAVGYEVKAKDQILHVTIGDAPNDAGLFRSGRFGMTVGTQDVLAQLQQFDETPEFVAGAREAAAFLELAAGLLALRT